MAFSTSGLTAWVDAIGDRAAYIIKPILAAETLQRVKVDKRMGIKGQSVVLPTIESTTPWQAGAACGFTTSGTTTLDDLTITTSPVKINEELCLNNLETFANQKALGKGDMYETFDLLNLWADRKLAQIALQMESAIWQAKTTYTNATHLKQFNGWISTIDGGSPIAATQQASISTSTVRGIFDDIIFTRIPSKIRSLNPIVVCGQDTYMILTQKLVTDNAFNFFPTPGEFQAYEMIYPGTNVKIKGLAGLNNDNAVDTGALPTAVKNRIFATYEDNFVLGLNAENDTSNFDVWYSKDDDVLRWKTRFHIGTQIKFTDLVVQYTNS